MRVTFSWRHIPGEDSRLNDKDLLVRILLCQGHGTCLRFSPPEALAAAFVSEHPADALFPAARFSDIIATA